MTSVLILLYLADLSYKLQPTFGIIGAFSLIGYIGWAAFSPEVGWPPKKLLYTTIFTLSTLIILPSPSTFYMFAGAETANTIVSSEIGKQVLDGLNHIILDYSKKSNQ